MCVFLFLQNAYKCSCSPRPYAVELVPEHLYIAMIGQFETAKSLTAIESDILVPCVRMVYDVSWNHKSRVSSAVSARSNNRNNIKKLTEKRENISVGFDPGLSRAKEIKLLLCLIP